MKEQLPICQVVGYKRSGKTTLMKKLTSYLTNSGLKIGTLKHHGHGGEPEIVRHTDSYEHMKAGSVISAVQGENRLQIAIQDENPLAFSEMLKIYTNFQIDLLLVEGFKQEDYPKIVLIRDKDDIDLLQKLTNIIAVGVWDDKITINHEEKFTMQDIDKNLPQLADYIKVKLSR